MTRAIKAGLLVDGTGSEPIPDVTIVVEGTAIQSIVRNGESVEIPAGAEIVDASDAVVIPGLIDIHVHLSDPVVKNPYAYQVETPLELAVFYGLRSAQQALAAGFTALRNMADIEFVSLRKAIDAGLVPGPRIQTSGRVLMTGGHADRYLPFTLPRRPCQTASGVDGVRQCVREHFYAGADFIKLETTGGVFESFRSYSTEEIKAIVEEAHGLGIRVAGHAHSAEGILRALDAGVDTLEHGTYVNDECIAKMVDDGVFFVPTLARLFDNIARAPDLGIPPAQVATLERLRDVRLAGIEKAQKAGVKVVVGSNAAGKYARHGRNAFELELLTYAGLSPMQSLMAGTSVAAEAMGLASSIGTVEAGKKADLVVVRTNPLDDLRVLQDAASILMVWKDGNVMVARGAGSVGQMQWPVG